MKKKSRPRDHDAIELFRSRGGWSFRVRSSNHEIIGGSGTESYTRRYDAKRAAVRLHPDAVVRVVG